MKNVLFVVSGNSPYYEVAPFIRAQGDSLVAAGWTVSYFSVKGKGMLGYLRNVSRLSALLKRQPVDIIHAHYSLCGWVAVLAWSGLPVVLSLMGDDAQGAFVSQHKMSFSSRLLLLFAKAIQPFVAAIVTKSPQLEKAVYRKKISHIIPNGVCLEQFAPDGQNYRQQLGLDPHKQYVLFLADPADPNKNIRLVKEALKIVQREDVDLLNIYQATHAEVVRYLLASDVFVLSSFKEGSANVIKEAMACNCPLVATPAGDAAWVIGNTAGCYLADYTPKGFADALQKALAFAEINGRTKGRERLLELGLDASSTAQKLIAVYKPLLKTTEYVRDRRHH